MQSKQGLLTLEGWHLDHLVEPLQDEKIRVLHCFRAKEHKLPGVGLPVIQCITRQHPSEILDGGGRKEAK